MIRDALLNIFSARPQPLTRATVRSRYADGRYEVVDGLGAVFPASADAGKRYAASDQVLVRNGVIVGLAGKNSDCPIYEV